MKKYLLNAVVMLTLGISGVANAANIVLDFEGINATYPSGIAFINDFYNGGTSSDGTSGTNFGITMSSNAQAACLNTLGVICSSASRGGLGDPGSARGALGFLSDSSVRINVPAGFDTVVSFAYSAIQFSGSLLLRDGVDGSGDVLAFAFLPSTPPNACDPRLAALFCPFVSFALPFSGTARSIEFNGVANQFVFDDVTFHISEPVGIPEPATLLLFGAGMVGMGLVRRRRL